MKITIGKKFDYEGKEWTVTESGLNQDCGCMAERSRSTTGKHVRYFRKNEIRHLIKGKKEEIND